MGKTHQQIDDLDRERTIADTILDRLLHDVHIVSLSGESLKKVKK
jgi:DNA replication protein DnaC